MASRAQDVWTRLLTFSSVGVGRAPAPTLPTEDGAAPNTAGADAPYSTGSNGGREGQRIDHRFVGGRWRQAAYALIDICCVIINGVTVFLFRFTARDLPGFLRSGHITITPDQPITRYVAFLLLYVALIPLFCEWQDLYWTPRTRSAQDESLAVVKAVTWATLLLTVFIYLSGVKIISRLIVVTCLVMNTVTLIVWRYAKRQIVIHRVQRGIGARNAVIVGAGKVGQALARQLEGNKLLGYRFVGFFDENHSGNPSMLGKIEDLARLARVEFVDDIFITIPSERELVKGIAIIARQYRLNVKVVPELYDGLGWHAPILYVGDFPVMNLHWQPIPTFGLWVKRLIDVGFSAFASLISLPLLAALAVWIKLDSPGPVLYSSCRVGKKGRVFQCYKLRTMMVNAEELKESLRYRNERQGPFFKIHDDPRITRSGKFLRKYSLDELPQFWNVFKGEMSLVGPRPHPADDYERYSLEHLRRLDVKPGITGLWQVTARRDPSFETNMRLDIQYIENWSLWFDIRILVRTIPEALRGRGR
jgi:exopolysaccharide biosynthesis polyprenyl glycosylphosphotransferase